MIPSGVKISGEKEHVPITIVPDHAMSARSAGIALNIQLTFKFEIYTSMHRHIKK